MKMNLREMITIPFELWRRKKPKKKNPQKNKQTLNGDLILFIEDFYFRK